MGIFDKDEEKRDEKPDFSNVQSGSSSTAPAPEEIEDQSREYTVERGDSLWKIAERYYGDGNQWRRIYEANEDQIDDPDVIHPGQTFTIPSRPEGDDE